jgi:hypothetical protein
MCAPLDQRRVSINIEYGKLEQLSLLKIVVLSSQTKFMTVAQNCLRVVFLHVFHHLNKMQLFCWCKSLIIVFVCR